MIKPRIRMFAGPNGSGKSTIIHYLEPHQVGAYLNADDLERNLNAHLSLNLSDYHPALCAKQLIVFLKNKQRPQGVQMIPLLSVEPYIDSSGLIVFAKEEVDSYLAARIIDYIRFEFLKLKISFTFETVMSHVSKVEFLKKAQEQGFRTYLYYVATVDPDINIARVNYRVYSGGHPVAEQKIRERYFRSLNLLMSAIEYADRAYIFDNSSNGKNASFIAEVVSAEQLKLNPTIERLPQWFVDQVLSEFH